MRGSDPAGRGYLALTTGVVIDSDDSNPVQTVKVRLMANELANAQRFTAYGHP